MFEADIMGFARYSKQSPQAVRSQLRQLETRHDIIVKTSELCLEYTLCEPASEEAVQEIVASVVVRQRVGQGEKSEL